MYRVDIPVFTQGLKLELTNSPANNPNATYQSCTYAVTATNHSAATTNSEVMSGIFNL